MGAELIQSIVKNAKKRRSSAPFFQTVTRFRYLPYDMNFSLQVIEALGQERFEGFVIDDDNRFVYENLIRWVHADPEFKCMDPETRTIVPGNLKAGIYLAGNTGTGKSWALELMSVYSTIDNVQVIVGDNLKRSLEFPAFRADAVCDEYAHEGSVEKYKKMSIVCFQDLGTEPIETLFMGNRQNVFEQILGYRGDRNDQITLISSNLPILINAPKDKDPLRKRYDERVTSRLIEMCNYFELRGKDRRKKQ